MTFLLTSMSDHKYMSKVSETTVNTHENHQNEFPFQVRTIVPPDLHQIQPRATQVCNCGKIGFDPNVKWHKVVCNYNLFQGEIIWKVKTGDHAPFWCTLLLFTRSYGKCFIPPIVVCQSKEYSQDLHHNIPLECTVHTTPSGYMDIYGCLKAMTKFSNICGASPFKNWILFSKWTLKSLQRPRPDTNAK